MRWSSSRTAGTAATLLAATVLGYELFIPPRVGVANNGDFSKIVGIFGLGAPSEDEYAFADLKYHFESKYRWRSGQYSSETMLAALGVGLNGLFSKRGDVFDLRWMGLLHGLLFVLGMHLIQPIFAEMSPLRRVFLFTAVVLFFCDFMYAGYFNTFYMDAAAYVSLMLAVVFFVRAAKWRDWRDAISLVACVVFLVLSKPQHAILGVWAGALLAFYGASLSPRGGRVFSIAAAAIVGSATILSLKGAPPDYAAHGYYTVIFHQVLPHSRDATRDLYALGLDRSYEKWIGTHSFSEGSGMNDPTFVRTFRERTSYALLGWFFLTHPRDAYLTIETSLAEAGRQRPEMGNFDRGGGLPAFAESRAFALWSMAKRKLFHEHGARYLACYILATVLLCLLAFVRRQSIPGVLVGGVYALSGMAMTAMLVASLADAVDVARHHLIAFALLDLQVLLAFVLVIGSRDLSPFFARLKSATVATVPEL